MSRQAQTQTGSVQSEEFTKIEPEEKHETLIENFLFRLKDDKSYQISPNSIELLSASSDSLSPRKYKPRHFEFRAYNSVTKGYLRFSKIHQIYKPEAEKLLFQIGRSKYRHLQQVVDVLTDFDIPEEASPSKGSISRSAVTFSWNQSSLHSPTKASGTSLSIYNMGMPYSWMDQSSEFIWVAMEDVLGDPDEPSDIQTLLIDKEMDAGDFGNQGAGFSQIQLIQYARQLVGGVAQMQLLGKPHGNICPKAFGVKSNGVVRLTNLFDDPCSLNSEVRAWADAYWYESKSKKWSFKDDALAVGRILLCMMLIGIQGPDDTLKKFTRLCNEGREKLARKIPYEKVQPAHDLKRQQEQDKCFKVLGHRKYDPRLISIIMKLVEPVETERIDALGALNFLENFDQFQDFQFSQLLMSEVVQANERLTTFESQDGKFEFSLNKSGRPPAQEGLDDQSLIEDQFDPEQLLSSPVHAQFLRQKEKLTKDIQLLRESIENGVTEFISQKEEQTAVITALETKEQLKQVTYVAKGWQNTNGILRVTIPKGKLSVKGEGVYTGNWQKGERTGFGIFESQDFQYVGYWDNDKPNGWGEKFYKLGLYQGDKFIGVFKDGLREGLGEYVSDEGDHIFGTWKNDIQIGLMEFRKKPVKGPNAAPIWYRGKARSLSFEGFGVLILNEGGDQEEMAGQFIIDKLDGYGTHKAAKGGKYTGYFKKSQYHGFGIQETDIMTSIGTFKECNEEGWCTVRFKNGDFYLGEMKQGVMDGFGVITQGGVVQYNGQFCEANKAGKGRMIRIGDFQYIGGFYSNKRHGFGVMISFDKWSYEGYFNQGKREGIGVLVMDEGGLHHDPNMTQQIEQDALVESREAIGKFAQKLEKIHSRQQEEEKKIHKIASSSFKKYDTESDDDPRMVRSFERTNRSHNHPSVKTIRPVKLDTKLRRTTILYKKSVAKVDQVRKYILHNTDDQRPYMSSSQSQGYNQSSSRPQSEELITPTKYETYTGAFRQDRRNGLGRCQYQDGSVYHGQWVLDLREGEDCTYITKKFRYTGAFKADMISGYGKQLFMQNGEEYEGMFFEGARHGQGLYTYKDGQFVYDGEWKYGRRSGTGKLNSADGSYCYDGDWKRDQPHGHGKERMLNGDYYEGGYVNGLREGHGKYQFVKNGAVYSGEWFEGLFQGRGQKWNQDGYHFDGNWLKGRATGFGVQYFANKDKYEGFFQNDMRSGYGIYYFGGMNQEVLCYGIWERGEPENNEMRWIEGEPTPRFMKWREQILKISNFTPSP